MTLKTRTTSGTGVFEPFFFLAGNDVATLQLATCVFLKLKKIFIRLQRYFFSRVSLFSRTWMLPQNNKGSASMFVHGSRQTAIKFLLKRNDIANDIEQRSRSQRNCMQPDIDPKLMSTVADIARQKNVLGNFSHNISFWFQVEACWCLLRIS